MSVHNSFNEFCCKRQLRIENGRWREGWSQERIFFKDRNIVACLYRSRTEENRNLGCEGEKSPEKAQDLICSGGAGLRWNSDGSSTVIGV